MNKIIIGGSIVFLLILVLGVYFLTRANKEDELITQKNKLQDAMILAENKLNKEKEILSTLTKGLQDSFPLAVSVQDQMKKSLEIIRQTDFMFTNSSGSNPELIVKSSTASALINKERRDINLLLSQWQKKIDLLSVEKINVAESEQIKKDAEAIKKFIEDLAKLVENLTPNNSGLSQSQIDTYATALPSSEGMNEVLASIGTAIENYNANNSPTSNTEINPGTNNNQNSTDSSPNTPPVIPNDVVVQEQVVVEAQTEVTTLQEQLAQVEEQIQQSSPVPIPPAPTPNETNPPENPDSGNQNTIPPREMIPSQGIIVQPGLPRLIQGTDPY